MVKNLLRVIYLLLFVCFANTIVVAQNPAVSITTFKNEATGAYNIIHDDFGDYGVIGINNYVDTMTFNRNIKITFGAITSSCESNPGMYAKAKEMIEDHNHEIINHSHTHSCAVGAGGCGGTGVNYQWAVPGTTDRLNIEVDQSTQSILTNTGVQPRFFIYPYDQFNANSNSYLQSKGYIGSRTGTYNAASPNNFAPNAGGFFQTALVVDASDNGSGLVIAKNLNYWVDQAIANKQWVNRELHNVGSTGWGSVDVTTYRNHLNYVKQKMNSGELWVGTISEILTYQIQKLNYTPTSSYNSGTKLITVNWNTPTFNVQQYLQNLRFKSPITLKVDVSNAAHVGNYQITQNGVSITDYKKVGSTLLINVYPHVGPVNIQIVDCASLCIATQPSNTTVLEGTALNLMVQASGGTITYQWYKNSVAIGGQTSNTLTIPNSALTDAGTYTVRVSNGTNTLTSSAAVVTVTPNPCLSLCITSQPQNYSTNVGTSASFSVTAQGVMPISYKWYKNNVLIPSATSSTYTIASTVVGDAGNYKVELTNSTGTVTSNTVTLTIYNQTPYGGSPINIPGTIQAENFDNGGQNISYFDSSPTNDGGATYRNNEVDIEVCNDGGAGYNIGYITDNEWLEYTVNVAATTNYNFLFRIASVNSGQGNGQIRLELDGNLVASGITLPFTANWTTYTSYTFNNVSLTAGVHVLRLVAENGDFNLNYVQATSSTTIAPTITFNNVTKTYGDASFTMAATSNSTGAITYTATGTGATISPTGIVSITGAGTVTVTASQAASSPFAAGSTTATITIAKKALTVTADNKSKSYNTANPPLTVTYTGGFVGSDNANSFTTAPTITTNAVTASPVGTYPITVTNAVSNNYSFTYVEGVLTVNAVTPTINFANVTKTYGDAIFNLAPISNSTGAITYSTTGSGATVTPAGQVTITGVGTVTVTASQIANGNYLAGTATATIIIAPKVLTVTAENKTKAFNTVNPPLTIVYSGFAYSETASNLTTQATATTTAVTNSPAGPYPITASGAASPNYIFNYVNGTLTVSSAVVPTITFANVTKTYGDASFSMTANSNSPGAITYTVLSGSAASISTSGVVTILEAGSATIRASQAASGSYAATTINATLTINRKALTITAEDKIKSFNTANPTLTMVYAGFAYAETVSDLTSPASITTSAVTNSPAGTYPITVSGAASPNYTFNYVNGTLTVSSAVIPSIIFASVTKTYGDASFTMTANSNSPGAITYAVLSGSAASISSSGVVTILEAGVVTIRASQAANGSYAATTINATLTINKKALTVTADNKSKIFNTANPSLTITYSGFAYSETEASLTTPATVSTSATINSPVGTYPIVTSGAASNNYTFTYVNGTLTINATAPTISFANISKTYGEASFTVQATSTSSGAITYSIISGTAATVTPSGVVNILGAGTVTIKATQAASGSYSAGSKNATLIINPKVLTVTADNYSRPYEQANPAFTVTYSGFAFSETVADLTNPATATTVATINSSIGDYPIIASGAQSSNYSFNYVSGTLTIQASDASSSSTFSNANTGKEGTIIQLGVNTPSSGSITYSISNGTGTAILNGDQLTLVTPGTVTITATIAANGNYDNTTITQVITITPLTSINNGLTGASDWKFYPIPATDLLTFQITLAMASNVTLELVEIETGRISNRHEFNFSSGEQMIQLPVSHLAEGIYLAKIQIGEQMTYKKITIVK